MTEDRSDELAEWHAEGEQDYGLPRLYTATDLRPATQPRWLARARLPLAAISLLVGDEGIGKSLLWVYLAAAVTTGKPLPEFGIPARDAARVILGAVTEDDWGSAVRPRLEVAGADLEMVSVVCIDDDGSGAPQFPRDLHLIAAADPPPALVVVDAWLDTVPGHLNVRDPQQARIALHPWKELATATDAAVLLLAHTNRTQSASARDRYGITGELRKKARMTLFAQTDDDGHLVVGPEKMNTTAPVPASMFDIVAVQFFEPSDDDDGTVGKLAYAGESKLTARELLAAAAELGGEEPGGNPARLFVLDYLMTQGGEAAANDVIKAGRAAGFSEQELKDARRRHRNPRIESRKASFGGGWSWAISTGEGGTRPPCTIFATFAIFATFTATFERIRSGEDGNGGIGGSDRDCHLVATGLPPSTDCCQYCAAPLPDYMLSQRSRGYCSRPSCRSHAQQDQ